MSASAEFKDPFYDIEWLMEQNAKDPVVQAYMKDVDVTLLKENLKLSVSERVERAIARHKLIDESCRAADAEESTEFNEVKRLP